MFCLIHGNTFIVIFSCCKRYITNPKSHRNGSQVEESRHDAYNYLYVYDANHRGNTEELGGRTMVNFILSLHAN